MSLIAKIRLGPSKIQLQCFHEYSKTQCENDFSPIKSLLSIKALSAMIFILEDYEHQFKFSREETNLLRTHFFYLLAFQDR